MTTRLGASLAALTKVDQGTISDAMVRLGVGSWANGIHAVNDRTAVFAGRARTLFIGPARPGRTPSLSKYAVIAALEPGDTLVIGGCPGDENFLGDNVGRFAGFRGLSAIVTESLARDIARLRELSMPVFVRGASARMPAAVVPIEVDVPVNCGGTVVRPGDVVVGGVDGLSVIPAASLADVLAEAEGLAKIEVALREAIEKGALLGEIEALGASKLAGPSARGLGAPGTPA